ncbi:hypothetical protein BCR43DRAFT_517364 [Syncephalastrum racemosum]|uniref:Uncharacterized protein n=1 Tax=Syncephalastrum racemosum TaxID=13706 RepID=A0A1X2H3W1_SYNRA|nr:hypothetical protein BCR43DRAFT_517364 [Syncephalastrum racemosum]
MGFDETSAQTELDWWNVAESSIFVFIAAGISFVFGTKLEISLLISGIRCVTQLTMMGYVLDDVLAANNPWLVMGLTRKFKI